MREVHTFLIILHFVYFTLVFYTVPQKPGVQSVPLTRTPGLTYIWEAQPGADTKNAKLNY